MPFSRNPRTGRIEAYTDNGFLTGFISTMGDFITNNTANDGGPGSGNFGHKGRPGKVGGSGPGGGSGENKPKSVLEPNGGPDETVLSPEEFDIFKYFDEEAEKYKAKEPEFQEKADKVIQKFSESGRIRNVAKAAKNSNGDYYKFMEMISPQSRKILEFQYKEISTEENWMDYVKRIQLTLSSDPKYVETPDEIADGIDITKYYKWDGKAYTDKKFGQVIDTQIEDIMAKQGYNGTPKVMKKEDFDKFISEHPDLPVMMRTFSAPNEELLRQYDKDLETGAWYVDCSVGGAKYGQGMYTAYAPQRHIISVADSEHIELSDEKFPDEVIKDEKGGLWQCDPNYEHTGSLEAPAGSAIFAVDDFTNEASIFIVKDPGKTLVDAFGEEYDISVLYGSHSKHIMKPVTEEEAHERDFSRPLGQMGMYINLNENREKRFNPEMDAYREAVKRIDDQSVLAYGHYGPDEVWGIEGYPDYVSCNGEDGDVYFKVNHESKPISREEYDKLPAGDYMITYEDRLSENKRSMMPIRVNKNGEKTLVDAWTHQTADELFDKIQKYNAEIHECQDVTPVKPKENDPKTTTRKMTLDPSTEFITFDALERDYNDYKFYGSGRIDNIGAFAAAKGYDAIVCSNYGKTIVVLNRTKLILSDERVEVPKEEVS